MGMPGSWNPTDHPYLTPDNHSISGEEDPTYNCIAWAAGDTERWWWPASRAGVAYWPKQVTRSRDLACFIAAFRTLGYRECEDGSLDPDLEKVALFARDEKGMLVPTHAARQLASGEWTSKMGRCERITHQTLEAVSGPLYGDPVVFLSRGRLRR